MEQQRRLQSHLHPDHIWQVAGKNYRVVQHGDLIRAVVSQLAELGLDDTHGRVDTWNMEGRIWITVLSPQEFQPLAGDTYRDGVIFGNSLDASSAVTAAYYCLASNLQERTSRMDS